MDVGRRNVFCSSMVGALARHLAALLARLCRLAHVPFGAPADLGGAAIASSAAVLFWLSTSYFPSAFLAALRAAASAIASGVLSHLGQTGLAVGSGEVTVVAPSP